MDFEMLRRMLPAGVKWSDPITPQMVEGIMLAERETVADEIERLRMENSRLQDQLDALARAVMGDIGNRREPLTTHQINTLVGDVYRNSGHMQPTPEIIVRAIERAHGIGAL